MDRDVNHVAKTHSRKRVPFFCVILLKWTFNTEKQYRFKYGKLPCDHSELESRAGACRDTRDPRPHCAFSGFWVCSSHARPPDVEGAGARRVESVPPAEELVLITLDGVHKGQDSGLL